MTTDNKYNGWTSEKSSPRDTTCNGWTNYATWRVNLEMLDGYEHSQTDTSDLADELRDFVESYLVDTGSGLARDYALAFIRDVNWYEIAEHLINAGE